MDPDPDSDPYLDSASFVIDLQDANKKLIFLKRFFAYYFLNVHLHQSHKTVGIKVFLTILRADRRIRIQ